MNKKETDRAQFATRLGVIATTVGSAVGLGNIWRFPYEAGNNGGGAFLLFYILFILILGIPVVCAEFAIGRAGRSNIFGSLKKLGGSGAWRFVGYIGIVASLMILSFYSVVAGWTLEYFVQSVRGALAEAQDYHVRFESFASGWRCVFWTVAFLLVNFLIVKRGVQRGVERMSNIMMPALFLILIVFCINSLLMPGAGEGVRFLFSPDFSKITWEVVGNALGQAFFSLSLGLGCMLTYASYFSQKTRIIRSATTTAALDTLVAIMSGVMIFPAIYTFGMSTDQSGPALVFEVLPNIFQQMTAGPVWSALFFFMLFLASVTSTISMSEISISFFAEQWKLSRGKACWINLLIALTFGVLCALSFGPLSSLDMFSIFNNATSNVLLPLGGMLLSIFAGWVLDRKVLRAQLTNGGPHRKMAWHLVVFCIKYVAPAGLAVILVMSLT